MRAEISISIVLGVKINPTVNFETKMTLYSLVMKLGLEVNFKSKNGNFGSSRTKGRMSDY